MLTENNTFLLLPESYVQYFWQRLSTYKINYLEINLNYAVSKITSQFQLFECFLLLSAVLVYLMIVVHTMQIAHFFVHMYVLHTNQRKIYSNIKFVSDCSRL